MYTILWIQPLSKEWILFPNKINKYFILYLSKIYNYFIIFSCKCPRKEISATLPPNPINTNYLLYFSSPPSNQFHILFLFIRIQDLKHGHNMINTSLWKCNTTSNCSRKKTKRNSKFYHTLNLPQNLMTTAIYLEYFEGKKKKGKSEKL